MKAQELIDEARTVIPEITEKTQDCPDGHFVVIHECGSGSAVISYVPKGWGFRGQMIDFGSTPMTENQVLGAINEAEYYLEQEMAEF